LNLAQWVAGRYYIPTASKWPVWNSCALVTGDIPIFAVFQMAIAKYHKLNRDHQNFQDVDTGLSFLGSVGHIFLFVVPEQIFLDFTIGWVKGSRMDQRSRSA
jgi:hypothetical protein